MRLYLLFGLACLFFLAQCGVNYESNSNSLDVSGSTNQDPDDNPFLSLDNGDHFDWGTFIHDSYQSEEITDLPIPIYPAFFSESELEVVEEAVDYANQTVGFEVFEVVNYWVWDARPIYQVSQIEFDEDYSVTGVSATSSNDIVGYTYTRNLYPWGKSEAARVVTDWAMEIRDDRVNKWVIAHELGHAMGIQEHALINYETAELEELEPDALMEAAMNYDPALNDYEYMMEMQGELLLDYLNQ